MSDRTDDREDEFADDPADDPADTSSIPMLPHTMTLDLGELAGRVRTSILSYDYATYERVRAVFTDREIATAAMAFMVAVVAGFKEALDDEDSEIDLDDMMISLISFLWAEALIGTADDAGSILNNVEQVQA
jgi:hypothetical protein